MCGRVEDFSAGSKAPCQAHHSKICQCSAGNKRCLTAVESRAGLRRPWERRAVAARPASGGNPKARLQGAGNRTHWLSSSDIKVCLGLAECVCAGKEAGAWLSYRSRRKGESGAGDSAVVLFDSGLQNTAGKTAAALLLTASVFLISGFWRIWLLRGSILAG